MRRALTALTMLFAFLLCFAGSVSAHAEFDALNRATWIRNQATGVESTFDYVYDDSGNVRRVEETHQGDVGVTLLDNRVIINDYDETYRLKVESITIAAGSNPTETTYVYDKANNRTSKIVTGGSNPGTEISAYGQITDGCNSNQLKTVTRSGVVTTFLYDANGNRRIKRVGSSTVQTYSYDFDNRLTSLTDNVKGTYAYTYDHRTRRVGRNESSANGGINAKLSFSGGLSVQEYTADPSTPNVETIRGSDYGGGIGGVLYTIRSGVRSYNAYNSRGDVVGQTNESGDATWQAAYEAFGTRTQEDRTTEDRQRANTKDEDPTGLLNEGFRYRDLEFGVFLTRDPLGFVDGPNVYTYVRQNPWTFFDPLGLKSIEDSLKDGKLDIKEAQTLEFKKGEAEGILDANKVEKVTEKSVRDDIVREGAMGGGEYVKDNMIWPNEDTGYYKNYKSGMSIDEVVVAETARRNQSKAKKMIIREFKDEKLKQFLQISEYSSHLMMEGSLFVIPSAGSVGAKLGTRMVAGSPRVFTAAVPTVNISGHGLRHVPEEVQASLSRAIQQDLIKRGYPAMGKGVQRSLQLNGKTYSYRAHGLKDGTTNVGTLLEGTYIRNTARPRK